MKRKSKRCSAYICSASKIRCKLGGRARITRPGPQTRGDPHGLKSSFLCLESVCKAAKSHESYPQTLVQIPGVDIDARRHQWPHGLRIGMGRYPAVDLSLSH